MNRKTARHSSLFLLELVAAIFFFCLASAVCVRFFVKSHTVSQDTHNLDMAVSQASSAAEIFRNQSDVIPFLEKQFPTGTVSDDGTVFTLYYDENWAPSASDNAFYALGLVLDTKEEFCTAVITVFDIHTEGDESEIYSLDTGKYIGEGAKHDT